MVLEGSETMKEELEDGCMPPSVQQVCIHFPQKLLESSEGKKHTEYEIVSDYEEQSVQMVRYYTTSYQHSLLSGITNNNRECSDYRFAAPYANHPMGN